MIRFVDRKEKGMIWKNHGNNNKILKETEEDESYASSNSNIETEDKGTNTSEERIL